MSDFQASLKNSLGKANVTLNPGGQQFLITENSNYSTNTNAGHAATNFADYWSMTVTMPDGTEKVFATTPANASPYVVADPPSTYGANGNQANLFPSAPVVILLPDGVYHAKLITVPTWNNVSVFGVNDCVYYDNGAGVKKLYRCIQAGANHIPFSAPTYWTVITEAQLDSRYVAIAYWDRKYDMEQSYITSLKSCLASNNGCACNSKNKCCCKATTLKMILDGIVIEENDENWDDVAVLITLGTKTRNCLCS